MLCHTGETIPLSDSDEEQDSDTESLDGVQREADMFLLSKAVLQFGVTPEAVRIAASMMKAKTGVQKFIPHFSCHIGGSIVCTS